MHIKRHLDRATLLKAASARIVLASDIEVDTGYELNIQTIKALTGGDKTDGVAVSTTILSAMNRLPHYNDMASYVKADRVRRVVVLPTVLKRTTSDIDSAPIDNTNLTMLLTLGILMRIRHSMPPLTTNALLQTLFHNRVKEALDIVRENRNATRFECVVGTMLLCWKFGIATTDLDNALQRVGTDCCIQAYGCNYIARLSPIYGAFLEGPQPVVKPKYTSSPYTQNKKLSTVWNMH